MAESIYQLLEEDQLSHARTRKMFVDLSSDIVLVIIDRDFLCLAMQSDCIYVVLVGSNRHSQEPLFGCDPFRLVALWFGGISDASLRFVLVFFRGDGAVRCGSAESLSSPLHLARGRSFARFDLVRAVGGRPLFQD
jgi:hypothetical protein